MSFSEKTTVMVVVQRWKDLYEKVDSLQSAICDLRDTKTSDSDWLTYALRDTRPSIKVLVAEYTKTKAELEDYLRTNVRFGEPDPICGGPA
jgi:hypothetical protein